MRCTVLCVLICVLFYNQPNCCKGLKVFMNRRFFLAGVVMNSAKTVGQKWDGGLKLRRAPWSKKWEARAHRPNSSLRLCLIKLSFVSVSTDSFIRRQNNDVDNDVMFVLIYSNSFLL